MTPDLTQAIERAFDLPGTIYTSERFPGGHINTSFLLTTVDGAKRWQFLVQRLNAAIFPRPKELMENILRVTRHVRAKLSAAGASDVERRVLQCVPRRDAAIATGASTGAAVDPAHFVWHSADGSCWRIYRYIEGTRVHRSVQTPRQAEAAGRAFGEFQRLLADYDGRRLHETIPGFHDTPLRFTALREAAAADACGRVANARREIDRAFAAEPLAPRLLDLRRAGQIPQRIVHNDAKISNVLFDEGTDEALCVVDLDTVMPGLSLHDFGDMVRSMSCTAAEDEHDPARIEVQPPLFEALAHAYLSEMGPVLTPAEREHLVTAGLLITLEQAVRFLTDYLEGDVYYRIERPEQNLDRARAQLALFDSLERRRPNLERILRSLTPLR